MGLFEPDTHKEEKTVIIMGIVITLLVSACVTLYVFYVR